jgi:hypothetical protein
MSGYHRSTNPYFDSFHSSGEQSAMRDLLFGDVPRSNWGSDEKGLPWDRFAHANDAWEKNDRAGAMAIWREIAEAPALESRHYLQAWHFLRQAGEMPPESLAKKVYGVVVEVGMENGADTLAAYVDGTVRYINYTNNVIVWEHPDDSLDATLHDLLKAGEQIALQIGPWEEDRLPSPEPGMLRLNILVPSGLHFGQAPFGMLAQDPLAAPVVTAATRLLQQLVEHSNPDR